MKYLKSFKIFEEGPGRWEFSEDGKQAIAGPVALPQMWDWWVDQEIGFHAGDMIMPEDNCYNYLWDSDDHVDPKKIDKMIEPHTKKNHPFGFNPAL